MNLLAQLNTLETAGLLRLAAVQPELEYLFRHALVQDAAYGSLLKADRKRLHRSAGEALEQLYAERADELASTLALHFEKAEQHDKAIHYFALAGDQARASYANNEAIQFYQAALAQIEATGRHQELQCSLYESLGDLLNLIGQRETARGYFRQAIAGLAEALAQARLYRKIALSLVDERSFVTAEENFVQGEELLQRTASTTPEWWHERVQNQLDRFWMYYIENQPEKIEQLVQQLQPWLEANGSAVQKARFYMGLTQIHLRRHRYTVTEEIVAEAYQGLAAAQLTDDPLLMAELHFCCGFNLLWHGDWARAETELEAAIALCQQTGNVTILARALTYLVVLHRLRKDIPKLQSLLPVWRQVLQTSGLKEYLPYVNSIEAWFAWRDNRFDDVERLAQDGLAAWGFFPFQWIARWPLLSVAFQRRNFSAAIEHAKGMLAPIQQKLPDAVTALLQAAVSAGDTGQPEAALAPLAKALQVATETGYL